MASQCLGSGAARGRQGVGGDQGPIPPCDRRCDRRLRLHVIIVSEPSAEAARRVRTDRSTPARSCSSAAHNDTPRHADARPISVHTRSAREDLRPLRSPRDRPTSAHRHQGRRDAASLARCASATLDPGDPTQKRPGMRERGASRSSPPATGRAKSMPDTAATNGVQRGARGTPIVTSRRSPQPIIAGQRLFLLGGGSRIRTLEGISRLIYSPPEYPTHSDLAEEFGPV